MSSQIRAPVCCASEFRVKMKFISYTYKRQYLIQTQSLIYNQKRLLDELTKENGRPYSFILEQSLAYEL